MTFEEFEAEAYRMWDEIPEEYREGIDGIVVKREAEEHPDHDDYYTMGMCFTEPYPSDYMGPESTRSILVLYYGSFAGVADGDPDFPWAEELWETITHELRHHLEFLAEDDALEGVDHALEQTFLRGKGHDFDPWYFQSGLPLAPSVYRVEYDVYIERRWRGDSPPATIEFEWDGKRWSVPTPSEPGDLHFVQLDDLDAGGGRFELVLVRDRGLVDRLRRLVKREGLDIFESSAEPTAVGDAPDSPGPSDGRPGQGGGGPPVRKAEGADRGDEGEELETDAGSAGKDRE